MIHLVHRCWHFHTELKREHITDSHGMPVTMINIVVLFVEMLLTTEEATVTLCV